MPSTRAKKVHQKEEDKEEQKQQQQHKTESKTIKDSAAEVDDEEEDDDDDYEANRLRNIRSNAALLEQLGLSGSASASVLGVPRNEETSSRSRKSRNGGGGGAGGKRSYYEDEDFKGGAGRRNTRSSGGGGSKRARVSADETRSSEGLRRSGRSTAGKRGEIGGVSSLLVGEGARAAEESALERSRRGPLLKKLRNPSPPGGWDKEGSGHVEPESDQEGEFPRQALPKRKKLPNGAPHGRLIFESDNRHFQPNVTPEEMLRGGIFGGTPFRPYLSSAFGPTRKRLDPRSDLEEFPKEWYEGLDEDSLMGERYDPKRNRFRVQAGQSLEDWEKAGWIKRQDPRGWWQWYFRFYLGRRTRDDARQIGRWLRACGPAGRFKRSLVQKIAGARSTWDDESISPVVRQTLWHWAYTLTEQDYQAYL